MTDGEASSKPSASGATEGEAEFRRCAYVIPMKHRTCNLRARPGSLYCTTHDPNVEGRVPCPKDPRHTVRVADLERHLKRCKGPSIERACKEPYFSAGVNLSDEGKCASAAPPEKSEKTDETDEGGLQNVKALWRHPEQVAAVVARLRELAAQEDTRGFMSNRPELRVLTYDKAAAVERDIFRSKASEKHGPQISSLVENMARENFLAHATQRTVFVEFGAGKAHLARIVAAALMLNNGGSLPSESSHETEVSDGSTPAKDPSSVDASADDDATEMVPFVLIDRAKFAQSTEKSNWGHMMKRGVAFTRIQIDISDLVLSKVPVLASLSDSDGERRVIAFGKHLCGMGCDTALRCVVRARQAMPADTQFAIAIALCCLHRCTWETYSNIDFIQRMGFTQKQFSLLTSIAAWATSGPDKQQQAATTTTKTEEDVSSPAKKCARCDEKEKKEVPTVAGQNPYSYEERMELGMLARHLLTEGRLDYLRKNGFPNARVVRYIDEETSPENYLLLAHTEAGSF